LLFEDNDIEFNFAASQISVLQSTLLNNTLNIAF